MKEDFIFLMLGIIAVYAIVRNICYIGFVIIWGLKVLLIPLPPNIRICQILLMVSFIY